MDETSLREKLERAVADRPPTPHLVPGSVRAGSRLLRRRRIEAAVGSAAALALIATGLSAVAGAFSPAPTQPGAFTSAKTAYVWTGFNSATPIRLSDGKALTPVKVPGVIQDIDATPNGSAVYVVSTIGLSLNRVATLVNYVTGIDTATGAAGRPVKLTGSGTPSNISVIQIAANGKLAYANESGTWPVYGKYGTSALVSINLATGAQQELAPTTGFGGWVMNAGGTLAYNASTNQDVNVFDLTTGKLLPPIKLRTPGTIYSIALAPGGSTLYAASVYRTYKPIRSTAWVTPISTSTDTAGQPIEVPDAGLLPSLAIAPDGKTAYVSGRQYLCPVSLVTDTALKPIRLPGSIANYYTILGISANSEFGYWYQPRSTSVQLINLGSGKLLRPVALPGGYRQSSVGIFPGGSTAYVPASIFRGALPSRGALFPLQLGTQQVGKPMLFSGAPNGVVLVP
jgi:hypothetical protein